MKNYRSLAEFCENIHNFFTYKHKCLKQVEKLSLIIYIYIYTALEDGASLIFINMSLKMSIRNDFFVYHKTHKTYI